MIPPKLKKRLRALKELSIRGVHGEKHNATEIYHRLLAQHGLKDSDIDLTARQEAAMREAPKKRRPVTEAEKAVAEEIADRLRSHIDKMYPEMWANVASTARVSVRNFVYNDVVDYFATH